MSVTVLEIPKQKKTCLNFCPVRVFPNLFGFETYPELERNLEFVSFWSFILHSKLNKSYSVKLRLLLHGNCTLFYLMVSGFRHE
jgi:hypothetical protein